MNTSIARQLLGDKMKWWEAVAEHEFEEATADSQSNFNYRLALQKQDAIKRNEKRVAQGNFGRCERCGSSIGDDRLESILDSEGHYCVVCAAKLIATRVPQKSTNRSNGHYDYSRSVSQLAYSY